MVQGLTGNDRGRNDDATNTKTSDYEDAPELTKVVHTGDGESSTASSHETRRADHQSLVVASEYGKQPKDDAGACQDRESNGKTAETYATVKSLASILKS
jgi:hypothetical protein